MKFESSIDYFDNIKKPLKESRYLKKYSDEDFVDLIDSKFGWSVAEQAKSILDDAPLEDQNENALALIRDFAKQKGETKLASELTDYLDSLNESKKIKEAENIKVGDTVYWTKVVADPENGPDLDSYECMEGVVKSISGNEAKVETDNSPWIESPRMITVSVKLNHLYKNPKDCPMLESKLKESVSKVGDSFIIPAGYKTYFLTGQPPVAEFNQSTKVTIKSEHNSNWWNLGSVPGFPPFNKVGITKQDADKLLSGNFSQNSSGFLESVIKLKEKYEDCPICKGKGSIGDQSCEDCNGSGSIEYKEEMEENKKKIKENYTKLYIQNDKYSLKYAKEVLDRLGVEYNQIESNLFLINTLSLPYVETELLTAGIDYRINESYYKVKTMGD